MKNSKLFRIEKKWLPLSNTLQNVFRRKTQKDQQLVNRKKEEETSAKIIVHLWQLMAMETGYCSKLKSF